MTKIRLGEWTCVKYKNEISCYNDEGEKGITIYPETNEIVIVDFKKCSQSINPDDFQALNLVNTVRRVRKLKPMVCRF